MMGENKENFERNIGLDFLRILSMIGIVGIHILNNGGVFNGTKLFSTNYIVCLIFYIIFGLSVDIFGILSGFLMYKNKQFKSSKIFYLVSIALFYSFTFTIISYIFNLNNFVNRGYKYWLQSLFPFPPLRYLYWYVTGYILMYTVSPFINVFIDKVNRKTFKSLTIVLFVCLSIIPNVAISRDIFITNFTPYWLIFLYIIGAYLGKYHVDINLTNKKLIYVFIICFGSCFALNLFVRITTNALINHVACSDWFIGNSSPFIIVISCCILLLFSNIKIKGKPRLKKIVKYLSVTSFSVYIIHNHVLIDELLKNRLTFMGKANIIFLIFSILGMALLIFGVCCIIDLIRQGLYKLFRIERIFQKIGGKVDKFVEIEKSL